MTDWALMLFGSMLVLVSFCAGWYEAVQSNTEMTSYIPDKFPWWIFLTGELIFVLGIIKIISTNNTFSKSIHQKITLTPS